MAEPKRLRQMLALPIERYIFIGDAIPTVGQISCGIVFIMAKWSEASLVAFGALNSALARSADIPKLRVFVLDTESAATAEWSAIVNEVLHGYGETYWIKDGVVVARLREYGHNDLETVKAFLDMLR